MSWFKIDYYLNGTPTCLFVNCVMISYCLINDEEIWIVNTVQRCVFNWNWAGFCRSNNRCRRLTKHVSTPNWCPLKCLLAYIITIIFILTLVLSCDVRVWTFSWASTSSLRSFLISWACFSSADEYKLDAVDTKLIEEPWTGNESEIRKVEIGVQLTGRLAVRMDFNGKGNTTLVTKFFF